MNKLIEQYHTGVVRFFFAAYINVHVGRNMTNLFNSGADQWLKVSM